MSFSIPSIEIKETWTVDGCSKIELFDIIGEQLPLTPQMVKFISEYKEQLNYKKVPFSILKEEYPTQ